MMDDNDEMERDPGDLIDKVYDEVRDAAMFGDPKAIKMMKEADKKAKEREARGWR